MLLGISSFTYGWAIAGEKNAPPLSEQELVALAKNFGLKCLQVGDNLPLHTLSAERLSKLKASVGQQDVRLEVGARRLTEEHLQRYIEITAYLQSPLLRFVIDGVDYEPDEETIISILKNALVELKKHNITLGIENHDRFKATALSSIMEKISDEKIGICLDTVNSIGAGEGLEWVTEVLAPFTVNLHIKEFVIKRFDHNMGFTVTGAPLGQGMLDIPLLMDKISRFHRCQSAVLEQWVTSETSIEATIKKERQWAEEGIRLLNQLQYFQST
jgi:sugar phosphate isomerase/epimerase